MNEPQINELAEKIYNDIIQKDIEMNREGTITLLVSVAWTYNNNFGIDLGITPESPEDFMLTQYVNARINEYNETKKNNQSL